MAEIRNLTRNGETFYPLTCTEGLVNREGNVVGEINDIFDVSEYNASGTPSVLAKYESLSLALADVPSGKQKGGMTIRYVQTSDNKYVQFRYMGTSTAVADFTNVANWQGIDDEPTAGSDNLITSGGARNYIDKNQQVSNIRESVLFQNQIMLNYWNNGSFDTSELSIGDTLDLTNVNTDLNRVWQLIDTQIDTDLRITKLNYHLWGSESYHNWIRLDADMKVLAISSIGTEYESSMGIANDVRYVLVQTRKSISYYASISSTNKKVVYDDKFNETNDIIQINRGDCVDEVYADIEIDTSQYETRELYINANKVWQTTNRNNTKVVPIEAKKKYIIRTNVNTTIALLKSYDASIDIAGATPDFCDGFQGAFMIYNAYLFVAPSDANYIVLKVLSSNVVTNMRLCYPVLKTFVLDEKIDEVDFKNLTLNPVDINNYETRELYINSSYVWQTTNKNMEKVVPVEPGRKYKITCNNDNIYVNFLKTFNPSVDIAGATPDFSDEMDKRYYAAVPYVFEVPSDTHFITLRMQVNEVDAGVALYEYLTSIEYTNQKYDDLINGGIGIIEQNNKQDLDNRFRQSRSVDDIPYVLTLLHFSDLHASWDNLKRIIELHDAYSSYIDDILQTGDLVLDKYVDSIQPMSIIPGADKILNVVGNHETRVYNEDETDWFGATEKDCYDKFIAPFMANWGSDVSIVTDKAYYYKDYPTQKIRLVVYDVMHPNTDQNTWLANILSETLDSNNDAYGYHVIIAKHSPTIPIDGRDTKIECNFSSVTRDLSNQFYMTANIKSIVQNFIDAGGIFVCYLSGHTHFDFVGKNVNYPNQLDITVASASYQKGRDYVKTYNEINMDLFNIVSINTYRKIISLFRIGCKHDVYNRNIYSMVYDYNRNVLIKD